MSGRDGREDPDRPGVWRRTGKGGLSECRCSQCGKWSTFGLVSSEKPQEPPYKYTCPECLP